MNITEKINDYLDESKYKQKTNEEQANEIIKKWNKVNVKYINRNGKTLKTEIESPKQSIKWHKDPDVDVKVLYDYKKDKYTILQQSSVGVERELTKG